MIQRPDFWDVIAKNVHVYREDIDHLEMNKIVLQECGSIPTDAIFCGTGWCNDFPFFDSKLKVDLGLPHERGASSDDEKWTILEKSTDVEVLEAFPELASPPVMRSSERKSDVTPNRLYQCIGPLQDRSIAFLGNVYVPNAFRVAEVQAVWATAFLDSVLQLPNEQNMIKDITWVNAFCKRRYPTQGDLGNFFHFDMVGYIDRLLEEVGLESHRRWWWPDLVQPLTTSTFEGIKDEYYRKFLAEHKRKTD